MNLPKIVSHDEWLVARNGTPAARDARSSSTTSATSRTYTPATPHSSWCPAHRCPSCSRTRSGWAGPCPGTPHMAASSTTTSTLRRRVRRAGRVQLPRPTRTPGHGRRRHWRRPRPQRFPPRRGRRLPHLLHLRSRHRPAQQHVQLPRPHRARPPGALGRAARTQLVASQRLVVAATRRIRARDQRHEESLPWVTSHSMASAGPMFPITHGQALAKEIPGARVLQLHRAGHGVERTDWEPSSTRSTNTPVRRDEAGIAA